MSLGDSTASDGHDICKLFSQNFSASYSDNSTQHRSYENGCSVAVLTSVYLSSIKFRDDQVLKVLKRLNLYKGAGTDGIPSVFVSKCATTLVHPLTLIYNKSLSSGIFPARWKAALVIPLFKTGERDLIKNYRPISILPVFTKVFEQLYPTLAWHFKSLINPRQHGFMRARSTSTNLGGFVNSVSMVLDRRSSVDAIYTDFSV